MHRSTGRSFDSRTTARTRWGGLIDDRVQPSGYFRVEQLDSVWWLVDPDGGLFLSKGLNVVRCDPDRIRNTDVIPYLEVCLRKHGSRVGWRSAAARRLLSWGFNSLGAWSDEGVATGPSPLGLTPVLDIGASFVSHASADEQWGKAFPDVFDPDFALHAYRRADEICAARRIDPHMIGWFTDNELRWGPDWRGDEELLTIFLNLPHASPGRCAAITILQHRYSEFDDFNAVWRTAARSWDDLARFTSVKAPYRRKPVYERDEAAEQRSNEADFRRAQFIADCEHFAGEVALRYFEATRRAVEAADPDHLVLGCRFAYIPPPSVVEAAGRHVDVVSFNCYEIDPIKSIDAYARAGKPSIISEFSFRADDSGLPNAIGAGPRVATQIDRARRVSAYLAAGLGKPTLVGYHWFEYVDEPFEGRFDGENSNYGVVTIRDDIYWDLARALIATNANAECIHGNAAVGTRPGKCPAAETTQHVAEPMGSAPRNPTRGAG